MQYILLVWLVILTYLVFAKDRDNKRFTQFILKRTTAIFWSLKNKKVIDFKDYNEGMKIANGEKSASRSLKDFTDMMS